MGNATRVSDKRSSFLTSRCAFVVAAAAAAVVVGRRTNDCNCLQQAEFEKEDIYEDLKRQEEKTDFSKMSKQEAEALKAEFHDKRFVVRGPFAAAAAVFAASPL